MNDPKSADGVMLEARAMLRELVRQLPPGAELPPGVLEALTDRDRQNPPGVLEALTDRDRQNLADAAARRARRNAKRLARKG